MLLVINDYDVMDDLMMMMMMMMMGIGGSFFVFCFFEFLGNLFFLSLISRGVCVCVWILSSLSLKKNIITSLHKSHPRRKKKERERKRRRKTTKKKEWKKKRKMMMMIS